MAVSLHAVIILVTFVISYELPLGFCQLSCRDERNKPVDWYVIYKIPKIKESSNEMIRDGTAYAYITSAAESNTWTISRLSMNNSRSLPGKTLSPLYKSRSTGENIYILYNDQPPTGKTSFSSGHTKGVAMTNRKGGFWLIHSVPHYPPSPEGKDYSYPETGLKNGQSYLCISLPPKDMETVGTQLMYNNPQIFSNYSSKRLQSLYPNLTLASWGKEIRSPPWQHESKLTSSGGLSFLTFAKSAKFKKDLYKDWVASSLQSDLLVQTWPNGPGRLNSSCQSSYKVQNIDSIMIPPTGEDFSTNKDHSKWAVAFDKEKPWVCIGDINRAVCIGDNMPSQICSKCIQRLDDWIKFKELCDNSNLFLQQCLSNPQPSTADDNDILKTNLLDKSSEKGNQLVIPDTLPDMDVSFFEQDSLFRVFDYSHQDIWPSADCLNTEFTEPILSPTTFNYSEIHAKENTNIENVETSEIKSSGVSKYKLKYDKIYKNQYSCEFCQKVFSKFSDLIKHDTNEHEDLIKKHSCPVCSRLFISENRVNLHVTIKHKEKCYECDICGVKTVSKKSLSVHKLKHSGRFTCSVCGLSTMSLVMLLDHERVHTGERPFACDFCDAKFSTKKSKDVHITTHTKSKAEYKCNVCQTILGSMNGLRVHLASHNNSQSMCYVCGKMLKSQASLAHHIKTHTEQKHSCSVCDKCFSNKISLQRHLLIHSNNKLFVCPVCDKSYNRPDTLKFHIQLHSGNKQFSCEVCDKAYTLKRDLIKHMKRTHNPEKKNKEVCTQCLGLFMTLKKHKCKKVNKIPVENGTIQGDSISAVKLFVCPVCKEGYDTLDTLKSHIQLHLANTEFTCDICDKVFVLEEDLNTHLKSVHNIDCKNKLEEVCSLCLESFSVLEGHKCSNVSHIRTEDCNKVVQGTLYLICQPLSC